MNAKLRKVLLIIAEVALVLVILALIAANWVPVTLKLWPPYELVIRLPVLMVLCVLAVMARTSWVGYLEWQHGKFPTGVTIAGFHRRLALVIYRQSPGEVEQARELLGLTQTEVEQIPMLERGEALWRVGRRSFIVQHRIDPLLEREIVDTDANMGPRSAPWITSEADEAIDSAS